jgi:hypothetical protein
MVSVTPRSAVRATSGASTKTRMPASFSKTMPSKIRSRALSSTSRTVPTTISSEL